MPALAVRQTSFAQGASPIPSWKTELRQLAPGIFAYIQGGGPAGEFAGESNAGLIVGPNSMMAVDSLQGPLITKAFLAAAKQAAPGKAFDRLVYTHHHGDHIDGAPYFMPVQIIGTEYCRKTVQAMAPLPKWEKHEGWAEGGEDHTRIPPGTILEKKLTYDYGDIPVELLEVAPAHTFGDLVVYLPEQKVLFAGDVGFTYIAPYAHWAHITKWIEAIDRILALDVNVIVPGHGPLGGKKELAETRAYLDLFKREARKRFDDGMTPGKAAASMWNRKVMGRFDSWRGADDRLPMNMVRAFHEFRGTLHPDMDGKGTDDATKEFHALVAQR
ncbi:MAG: MBL fold metallo-hydrolase [Bryobacteraceae bacterium]